MNKPIAERFRCLLQMFPDWVNGSGLTGEKSSSVLTRFMSSFTDHKAVSQTETEELSSVFSVFQLFTQKK